MTPEADAYRYHPRRMEKAMPDLADQLAVLRGQELLTLAMCRGNEPYLVTLDYVFVEAENCLYVHCANAGKKLDFLRKNPRVWGQVVEDRGYIAGECSHAYRSVMFDGGVEFIDDADEKLRALGLLIERFEPEPAEMKARLLQHSKMGGTTVVRIRIVGLSGKQSPPPTREA